MLNVRCVVLRQRTMANILLELYVMDVNWNAVLYIIVLKIVVEYVEKK